MANEEFYNFEEALDQLRLKEEELKRLVSEGEIRAFREGETMRLRRADVENLKQELSGGQVVDLDGIGEELVFEDDAVFEEAGMATEEISEMDTLLEEDVDDVEDVDELEIDDIEDDAPRRPIASTVKPVEEPQENLLFRALTIVTAAVLLLAFPITISLSSGNVSSIAKSIAGMFGLEMS